MSMNIKIKEKNPTLGQFLLCLFGLHDHVTHVGETEGVKTYTSICSHCGKVTCSVMDLYGNGRLQLFDPYKIDQYNKQKKLAREIGEIIGEGIVMLLERQKKKKVNSRE